MRITISGEFIAPGRVLMAWGGGGVGYSQKY